MAIKALMLLINCFDLAPRVYIQAKTLAEHGDRATNIGISWAL